MHKWIELFLSEPYETEWTPTCRFCGNKEGDNNCNIHIIDTGIPFSEVVICDDCYERDTYSALEDMDLDEHGG